MQEPKETWVEKIPMEEDMASHSSIIAWRIPWTEEPGGLHSVHSEDTEESDTTEHCLLALSATLVKADGEG